MGKGRVALAGPVVLPARRGEMDQAGHMVREEAIVRVLTTLVVSLVQQPVRLVSFGPEILVVTQVGLNL